MIAVMSIRSELTKKMCREHITTTKIIKVIQDFKCTKIYLSVLRVKL